MAGHPRLFNVFSISVIVITIAWAIAFDFALLFICKGHFVAWWQSIKELDKYCRTELEWKLGYAISDFIMDLIILAMPMPLVSHKSPL